MFEREKIKQDQEVLESPQLHTIIRFSSEKTLRPIVVLGNGRAFLWEKNSGEGRIIGFSVPPTTQWSDFPLKGIFIPLLYQSVLYLSGPISNVEPMENVAGNPIEISTTRFRLQNKAVQSSRMVSIQIVDPGKKETVLQSHVKDLHEGRFSTVYTFDQAMLPGMYTVRQGRDTLAIVPVNMDRAESDGSRIEKEKVVSFIQRYGIAEKQISFVKPDDSLDTIVLQSRFGIELWKYFLLAAFLTAIGEMIVARESKQEAFG
jgi:hypothetical protein